MKPFTILLLIAPLVSGCAAAIPIAAAVAPEVIKQASTVIASRNKPAEPTAAQTVVPISGQAPWMLPSGSAYYVVPAQTAPTTPLPPLK